MGRKVDVGLLGEGNSNSHGARPVHQIISMVKWIRTRRLSIKNYLSLRVLNLVSTTPSLSQPTPPTQQYIIVSLGTYLTVIAPFASFFPLSCSHFGTSLPRIGVRGHCSWIRDSGFGFRDSDFRLGSSPSPLLLSCQGFGVWLSGFVIRDSGFGIRALGSGIRDSGFGIRDSGFGVQDLDKGVRVEGVGIRMSGLGLRKSRFGCKSPNSGFGCRGSGFGVPEHGPTRVRRDRTLSVKLGSSFEETEVDFPIFWCKFINFGVDQIQ